MLKINDKHSYDTFCKEKGESLECIGIREYVFTRKHALELVDLIDSPKIAIVGGDIYRKNNLDFESTCDSWHYENERNTIKGVILVDDEYIKKCKEKTTTYINNYPDPEDGSIYYCLVLTF